MVRNGTRQQRIHTFRPLFVYRQEQIKKNRVKPKPKPKPTTTPSPPTYNPDRVGSAYPFYGTYYPSYVNYPYNYWSNYYSSYYYPQNYYNSYPPYPGYPVYPSSGGSLYNPSNGFYLPSVPSSAGNNYQKPSGNLEAPILAPALPPLPTYLLGYPQYSVPYWRK